MQEAHFEEQRRRHMTDHPQMRMIQTRHDEKLAKLNSINSIPEQEKVELRSSLKELLNLEQSMFYSQNDIMNNFPNSMNKDDVVGKPGEPMHADRMAAQAGQFDSRRQSEMANRHRLMELQRMIDDRIVPHLPRQDNNHITTKADFNQDQDEDPMSRFNRINKQQQHQRVMDSNDPNDRYNDRPKPKFDHVQQMMDTQKENRLSQLNSLQNLTDDKKSELIGLIDERYEVESKMRKSQFSMLEMMDKMQRLPSPETSAAGTGAGSSQAIMEERKQFMETMRLKREDDMKAQGRLSEIDQILNQHLNRAKADL